MSPAEVRKAGEAVAARTRKAQKLPKTVREELLTDATLDRVIALILRAEVEQTTDQEAAS